MSRAALSAEVVGYIKSYIDSVPELEALILLRDSAPRGWTPAEIATRVYVDEPRAVALLSGLERKGLVLMAGADAYVYAADNANAALFDRVAESYRTHLVKVAELVHSKTPPALREFARAFRFKE